MSEYKIWTCKIVVLIDAKLPEGFDAPPRRAAIEAVTQHVPVLSCFSGWGGSLNESELKVVNHNNTPNYPLEDHTRYTNPVLGARHDQDRENNNIPRLPE